ncbi:hypothetical protein [Methylobacterium sp. J-090]|uniref:hypothetical protein n=1 Tax=Methylobacterium sp. J-090 TaxID=2836666 RepID=UPI001FBBEE43|nr:hypothetical protein [Methylobacterium sp. J-090]MCJ2079888.1 hypothetical protein [Methylobacterium sp. J-090]
MDAVRADNSEAQLRYDALRKGIVLTEEALEAYRGLTPALGGLGPGASFEGVLGGLVAGNNTGGTMGHGVNAGVDVRPKAGNLEPKRTPSDTVRASVGGFLDALANIQIKVRPLPPRDYIVTINGRSYPASERSIYAIPPGIVQISVSRKGKHPCQWAGAVGTEGDKVLDCRL